MTLLIIILSLLSALLFKCFFIKPKRSYIPDDTVHDNMTYSDFKNEWVKRKIGSLHAQRISNNYPDINLYYRIAFGEFDKKFPESDKEKNTALLQKGLLQKHLDRKLFYNYY